MDKQTDRQIGEQMEIWKYGWLDGQNRQSERKTKTYRWNEKHTDRQVE